MKWNIKVNGALNWKFIKNYNKISKYRFFNNWYPKTATVENILARILYPFSVTLSARSENSITLAVGRYNTTEVNQISRQQWLEVC